MAQTTHAQAQHTQRAHTRTHARKAGEARAPTHGRGEGNTSEDVEKGSHAHEHTRTHTHTETHHTTHTAQTRARTLIGMRNVARATNDAHLPHTGAATNSPRQPRCDAATSTAHRPRTHAGDPANAPTNTPRTLPCRRCATTTDSGGDHGRGRGRGGQPRRAGCAGTPSRQSCHGSGPTAERRWVWVWPPAPRSAAGGGVGGATTQSKHKQLRGRMCFLARPTFEAGNTYQTYIAYDFAKISWCFSPSFRTTCVCVCVCPARGASWTE